MKSTESDHDSKPGSRITDAPRQRLVLCVSKTNSIRYQSCWPLIQKHVRVERAYYHSVCSFGMQIRKIKHAYSDAILQFLVKSLESETHTTARYASSETPNSTPKTQDIRAPDKIVRQTARGHRPVFSRRKKSRGANKVRTRMQGLRPLQGANAHSMQGLRPPPAVPQRRRDWSFGHPSRNQTRILARPRTPKEITRACSEEPKKPIF